MTTTQSSDHIKEKNQQYFDGLVKEMRNLVEEEVHVGFFGVIRSTIHVQDGRIESTKTLIERTTRILS